MTRGAKRLVLLIAATLAVPIVPFVVVGELPGERWLSGDLTELELGALGAGLLAADAFLPIPSTVVGTLLGYRLGLGAGFAWSWLGLVAGSLVGYGAGRWALRRAGVDLPTERTATLLFLTRPVPVLAEAVAIAAGAGGVPMRSFAWATVTGNAVYAAALAGSGAAWLSDTWVGVGLVAPMGLPVLGWWLIRRWRHGS